MKLVYLEWIDSRGVSESWYYLKDLESKCCILKSVGWVIKEDRQLIHIVPHVGDDPKQGCGDMVIPKRCVLKKIEIIIDEQSK